MADDTAGEHAISNGKGAGIDKSGADRAKSGGKDGAPGTGKVDDQVSNDVSDAEATPEDKMPKDNSHNFT